MANPDRDNPVFVLDEPPEWVSVAALQCRLRELFAGQPPHRALAAALQAISELLVADYAVVHARFGALPLSEEWCRDNFDPSDALREAVTTTMVEAKTADEARCVLLSPEAGAGGALVAAVLYDEGYQQAGTAAFVFRDHGRARALAVLVQAESLVGFMALLLSERARPVAVSGAGGGPPAEHVGEPARLLLDLAAELGNRHGLDQVAIGIVQGPRVRVALMNGEAEPRPANPGVRQLRDAMSECLDHGAEVVVAGDPGLGEFRLHAVWLHSRGGGAVGSLPMVVDGQTVAIVSVASADPAGLTREKLVAMGRDLAVYPPLVRVAALAARSLAGHFREAFAAWRRRWLDRRRGLLVALLSAAVALWAVFGTLPYSLTVPCLVKAIDSRTVSCPRDGILAEFFVRPGDSVRSGQLLAELDSYEDRLARAELESQQHVVDAQIDRALADRDASLLRVLEAQRAGVLARLAMVERRIDQARIRAPQEGVVLTGDLRERLGSRVAMGDGLYQLARSEGALIQLRIPERALLDARGTLALAFVSAADPSVSHVLTDLRIPPSSTVTNGNNVFLGEARAEASLWRLAPGMEGVAMLEVGPRPVWWVIGHRVIAWLRLNFWI